MKKRLKWIVDIETGRNERSNENSRTGSDADNSGECELPTGRTMRLDKLVIFMLRLKGHYSITN